MPHQHGGCVYPDAVLSALHAAGSSIDYAWLAWPFRSKRLVMRDPLQAGYVDRGHVPGTIKVGGWRIRLPGNTRPRTPIGDSEKVEYEPPPTKYEQSFFRKLVIRIRPKIVLIDFATTLSVLDGLSVEERSELCVAVLTHNLVFRRTELYRERNLPLDFRPLNRVEEATLLRRADVIVAIQEREAEQFRTLVPDRKVVVVPMPVQIVRSASPTNGNPRCLFVGGYSGHNLDGLRWFLADVWPKVLILHPDALFDVVGTVGEAVSAETVRVCVHGAQSDLTEFYARATVCVVPLRFGTGLKIKLIEAMAHGRAVVSTLAGAEGFPELERGEVASVSITAAEMASSIAMLLLNDVARTEQIERQTVWLNNRFSGAKAVRPLISLLNGTSKNPIFRDGNISSRR